MDDAGGHGEDGRDDARRRLGLRVVEVRQQADAPKATNPATPTHGRRTDARPSDGAERDRHDDDADDEGDLVVRAEHRDGEVLERRRRSGR